MHKKIALVTLALGIFTLPLLVSAHERQLINIGGTDYLFVVGSLGEPLVVDDKSGVELRVSLPDPKDPTNTSAVAVKPVTGLEQALKVEIQAGNKKKTFDLTTIYGAQGSYKAIFFPTVETALTYRFTGTINNIPVDLSFPCAAQGSIAIEDKSSVTLGDGVVRTYKNGQFGCPMGKAALGFPEGAITMRELHEGSQGYMNKMMNDVAHDSRNRQASTGLAFGFIGIILGVVALWKTRTPKV